MIPKTNALLNITISSPSTQDSRDDGHVTIEITDALSREVLASIEMPAGRWWRLCQSSTMTVDGFVSPHLERVGKKQKNESIKVPKEVYGAHYREEEVKPLIEEWLLTDGNKPVKWETYRINHHNWGWGVVGYWYEYVTEEDVQNYREGYLL